MNMNARRPLRRLIGAALLAAPLACLAQSYPSKPIRVLVPFGAGSLPDTLARQVGERISPPLGQPVIVENKPGGGTVVAQVSLADKDINYAAPIREATGSLGSNGTAGIFISMRPQQARLLVAQLRGARITAPVFATSHIYAGDANATLDRDLNGVEFCDAPWLFGPIAGRPDRAVVTSHIDSANGAGGRLFAFGMDAYALLPYLDWLTSHPDAYLNGASGQLTVDHFGRVHRLVGWARFDNGLAVPLTGALDSSPAPAQ